MHVFFFQLTFWNDVIKTQSHVQAKFKKQGTEHTQEKTDVRKIPCVFLPKIFLFYLIYS